MQGANKFRVLQTDLGPIAILICYDVEFPELCHLAAAQGALLFFVPSNTADRQGYLRVRSHPLTSRSHAMRSRLNLQRTLRPC